jgi:hypothetical protein
MISLIDFEYRFRVIANGFGLVTGGDFYHFGSTEMDAKNPNFDNLLV